MKEQGPTSPTLKGLTIVLSRPDKTLLTAGSTNSTRSPIDQRL